MTAWYALRTAPQKEFALVGILHRYEIQAFCPTETKWRKVPGTVRRKKPVIYAMLPRYIFAACGDPWDVVRAHRHRGVQGVVSFDGQPARIADAAIWRLAKMSGNAIPTGATPVHKSFSPGDLARYKPVGDEFGYLVPIETINGRTAEIMMDILGAKRLVKVDVDRLEAA